MKTSKIIAIIVAGLFSGSLAKAQEVLTLQQAIKYALENKADAKKTALELENAQYQIDEVRGSALPQINGSATLKYNIIIPEMAIDMGGQVITAKMGQPWNSTAGVSLNQQLFNQAVFTGLKAARTTQEFYQINKELSDEQLIEKVANSYYGVYQTQLQLQTIQTNLDNTIKTHNIIKGLVDAGLAKKIDLDRMAVAVNNYEASKTLMQNSLDLQENALKFVIGMDVKQDIRLPEETFAIDASLALQENTLDNRAEVRLLEKQLHLLELNKQSKVADLYPRLSLGADFGWNGFGQGFPIGGDFLWPKTSSIGLNLSIPIFAGGSTKARIKQADIQIRQAQVSLEDTKLGLSLANENAKVQIKNSLLTINTNQVNVKMAKEVLDNTQNNYRNGLATLTDLLDAEKAYADAQNNLTTSLLNYKVAEIQLIKANGQLKSLINE